MRAQAPERRGEEPVNRAVGLAEPAERRQRRRHRIGELARVPHGAATRGTAHAIELEGSDPLDIVPAESRLVAAEGEAVRLPAIESEKRGALPGREVEKGGVDGHVRPTRPGGVDEKGPAHQNRVNSQQSTVNGSCRARGDHRARGPSC